ncbi:amidohydrolase family protein [Infirmifilum lucidum]|uniref:Amidohydrolase family protein n=1 Tax=Infirmifilum lucidum TaxID=2776706 RepID=A0A7L9FHW4_9CREN|nr:amidohydrolase family protein [Infirmifilum lucidum]QOJ79390.1 amidohydrolase family protein [Infirmifilum lucidum]
MRLVFRECSYILSPQGLLRNIDIAIEDGKIVAIGRNIGGDEEVDCRGLVSLPGFANVHTHLSHVFAAPKVTPSWENHHVEAHSREAVEHLLRLALIDSLEHGVTLVADTTAYPDVLRRVAAEVGVKAVPAVPWRMHGRRERGIVLESLEDIVDFSEEIKSALEENPSAVLFVHVANSRFQVYASKTKYGKFPIELVDSKGLLSNVTILVNPGWAASWELKLISKRGSKIAYAPVADAFTASGGSLPAREVGYHGITSGLCTESPLLGLSLSVLDAARHLLLLQRSQFWERELTALEVLDIATRGGYSILGFKGGVLEEGAPADLVFFYTSLVYVEDVTPERLLFSLGPAGIKYVLVDGKFVLDPPRKRLLEEAKRESLEKLRELSYEPKG